MIPYRTPNGQGRVSSHNLVFITLSHSGFGERAQMQLLCLCRHRHTGHCFTVYFLWQCSSFTTYMIRQPSTLRKILSLHIRCNNPPLPGMVKMIRPRLRDPASWILGNHGGQSKMSHFAHRYSHTLKESGISTLTVSTTSKWYIFVIVQRLAKRYANHA